MDSSNVIEISKAVSRILQALGEDPAREGLSGTPMRVARFWSEFIGYSPGYLDTRFEAIQTDQMVVLAGIRVYSMCEHHLLPFICDVSIGYLTSEHVIGISKLARIAQKHAHRLQMQERLCNDIAAEMVEVTGQPSVAVLAEGQHLCMMMRGIHTDGKMVTSVMYGKFRELEATRAEFFKLVEMAKGG